MSRVHIVTDSSCDLTEAETSAHGVGVVPLSIRFGNDEYVDREQLSVEDFYAKMASTGLLPETAAPSPGRFEQEFRAAHGVTFMKAVWEDDDHLLVLTYGDDGWAVLRLGVDGSVEVAVPPISGDDGQARLVLPSR